MSKSGAVFLISMLFVAGCDDSSQEPNQDNELPIELGTSVNQDFGISCSVPQGWEEYMSGRYKSSSGSFPSSELVVDFYPQMDGEWIRNSIILPALGITEFPSLFNNLEGEHFTWNLYSLQIETSQSMVDLAIGESDEGVFRVTLTTNTQDYNSLHNQVFMPAVKSFRQVDTRDPNFSYQESLLLFDYDAAAPLDILMEDSVHVSDFSALTFTYASPKGGRVPATILLPDGPGPFPGLVFMHSMPGTRQNIIGLAEFYAKTGAVGILIDAPHGRPENQNRPEGPVTLTEKDREEQIQVIVDLRRAIDILTSRTDIDPNKLAFVGASYGGSMGGLLAGIEDRLKAYVLIVGAGGLVERATGFDQTINAPQSWIDAMWPIEPIHFAGYASPAALLYQSGLHDQAITTARAVSYQRAGSEPKEIMWYDSDHWLTAQAYEDQQLWLQQFIQ